MNRCLAEKLDPLLEVPLLADLLDANMPRNILEQQRTSALGPVNAANVVPCPEKSPINLGLFYLHFPNS